MIIRPPAQVATGGDKVQRSGQKVQGSGPGSAQVSKGCSNNIQIQPPPTPTRTNTARCSNHCYLCKGTCTNSLQTRPLPTYIDVGPDLSTFCPALCTMRPDLHTLRLWYYPSINQHKYSTCTNGSGHWLVAFFLQPFTQTLVAPVVVPPVATNLHWWYFPSTHWRTYSTCTQATCTVWWWATCTAWCWTVVVANLHCMVIVCSGGQLALYGGDLW